MTNREFLRQVDAYGLGQPDTQNGDFWVKLLGLPSTGSGYPRDYSWFHVRAVVAWQMLLELCGRPVTANADLLRDAAWEMAEHDFGWVVITEGTVNWTRRPTARVFDRGAVCIPVPKWLDERTTVH